MEELVKMLQAFKKEIPYKWRVQSFSKNKPEATCVAYIDARDVMNILDENCKEGWTKDFKEVKKNMFCGIGICINGSYQWRWDCGTESSTEKEKGEASDSFKRAAVNWGIGRFLYDLDIIRVPANEAKTDKNYPFVVDNGKKVWNITEFINSGRYKTIDQQQSSKANTPRPSQPATNIPEYTLEIEAQINEAQNRAQLTSIWNSNKALQANKEFADKVSKKSVEFKVQA